MTIQKKKPAATKKSALKKTAFKKTVTKRTVPKKATIKKLGVVATIEQENIFENFSNIFEIHKKFGMQYAMPERKVKKFKAHCLFDDLDLTGWVDETTANIKARDHALHEKHPTTVFVSYSNCERKIT